MHPDLLRGNRPDRRAERVTNRRQECRTRPGDERAREEHERDRESRCGDSGDLAEECDEFERGDVGAGGDRETHGNHGEHRDARWGVRVGVAADVLDVEGNSADELVEVGVALSDPRGRGEDVRSRIAFDVQQEVRRVRDDRGAREQQSDRSHPRTVGCRRYEIRSARDRPRGPRARAPHPGSDALNLRSHPGQIEQCGELR